MLRYMMSLSQQMMDGEAARETRGITGWISLLYDSRKMVSRGQEVEVCRQIQTD